MKAPSKSDVWVPDKGIRGAVSLVKRLLAPKALIIRRYTSDILFL